MNRDIVEGHWKRLKGNVRVRWCMLIGDHLGVVSARRTQVTGERQLAYGVLRSKKLRGAMRTGSPLRSISSNTPAVDSLPAAPPVLAMHTLDNH